MSSAVPPSLPPRPSGSPKTPSRPRTPWRAETIFNAALEQPPKEREAYLAQACGDDTVLMAEVRELLHDLAFSPDGKVLLSAHESSDNAVVNAWPTRLGEEIGTMAPSGARGRHVLFNGDGSLIYGVAAAKAGAWEARSGLQKWDYYLPGGGDVLDLAIHPADGSMLLSEQGKEGGFTRLPSAEQFGANRNSSLKFNRRGQLLLAVDNAFVPNDPGWVFTMFEYPSGKVLAKTTLTPHQPFAAFCLDDTAVATATLKGGITVWDWKAGAPLRKIDATQTGSIACLASSPDGRTSPPADPTAGFASGKRRRAVWKRPSARTGKGCAA